MGKLNFNTLNLSPEIQKVLAEIGYEHPTEVQQEAIPVLLNSEQDFIGQAQTGTGKTAAFVIPLLEKIDPRKKDVQAIILTPTRELANQVENEIQILGKYTEIKSTSIYGGSSYEKQTRELKKGRPHIVVGTPGRVIDMIKRGILKLGAASFCVLDEADEMLNMGFIDDVQIILNTLRDERQLIMFSATMPKAILTLVKKSFRDYHLVKIEKKSLSNADIEQKYFIVRPKHMREALTRIIDHADDPYAIVFCRTKLETRNVGEELTRRGHHCEILNGDMSQGERDFAMRKFKEKNVTLLICTDVAARGIDVNNLTHVINFGLPQDNESYVHRIGRTGRAGMKGKAYSLVTPKEAFIIRKIERDINQKITFSKLPTIKELKRRVVEREVIGAQQILGAIQEKGESFKTDEAFEVFTSQFADLSQEDLLKLMFTWKFNKSLRHYNNLSDIEHVPSDQKGPGRSSGRGSGRSLGLRSRKKGPKRAGSGQFSRGKRGNSRPSRRK